MSELSLKIKTSTIRRVLFLGGSLFFVGLVFTIPQLALFNAYGSFPYDAISQLGLFVIFFPAWFFVYRFFTKLDQGWKIMIVSPTTRAVDPPPFPGDQKGGAA